MSDEEDCEVEQPNKEMSQEELQKQIEIASKKTKEYVR